MKVENGYLYLEKNELKKKKKITGHSFVQLLGYDNFTPIGDCLLSMHGIYTEKIDEKWLKRGDFAEKVIQLVYKRDKHEIVVYDKKQINYDNFQNYEYFGGIIDIPTENRLVEVKSKSIKDYDYIIKNIPKAEIYQALYYGYLKGYNSITMEYVFFDKQTENEVFNGVPVTTIKNLKRFSKDFKIDFEIMKQKLIDAKKVVLDFRANLRIPISQISDKVLKELGLSKDKAIEDMLKGFDF